jgi:hypothetical protein
MEVSMEVYNSTMMELSTQAVKIGLVYDQVHVKGEYIVNDLHDHTVALYDQTEEKVDSSIKDVKQAPQVQKKQATSFLKRNAHAAVAAVRNIIFGGCTQLVRVVPPFGSSRSNQ